MKILNFAFITLLLCQLFTNCKKGEDDPLLSLRTRKARVVGEWKIKSGTENYNTSSTGNNASANSISTSYTDARYSSTTTYSDSAGNAFSDNYTGSVSYTMEFKKNGEFFSEMITDNQSRITQKGTWNFTAGIGTHKNKEQIVIHLDSYVSQYLNPIGGGGYVGGGYSTFSKGSSTDLTYTIKELRNKKIVLTSEKNTSDNSGYEYSLISEFTFEQ
ncbi:hypothetical protein CNR22_10530 [Sphingobacteriaceae bacterium]|nr:hypothetical protein CNR22_10530 [Sphingobacteriaceae bacterium]